MGTWGAAIFSDDLATEVKDEWRDHIAGGLTPAEATDRILADHPTEADADVVRLALAVAQWRTGRLLDAVRDAAVVIIDSGRDLQRWPEGRQRVARQKALMAARQQLLSPQPAAKKIARRSVATTPFSPGDVIRYRHAAGATFVLWVSHNQSDRGGVYSDAEVLDGSFDPTDTAQVVRHPGSEFRYHDGEPVPRRLGFVLLRASKIPAGRYDVVANVARPAGRPAYDPVVINAGELDDWLRPFLPGGDRILRHPQADLP